MIEGKYELQSVYLCEGVLFTHLIMEAALASHKSPCLLLLISFSQNAAISIGFSRKFQRQYVIFSWALFILSPLSKRFFHSIQEHTCLPQDSEAVIHVTLQFLKIWFFLKTAQNIIW